MSQPFAYVTGGDGFPCNGGMPGDEIVGAGGETVFVGAARERRTSPLAGHIVEKTRDVRIQGVSGCGRHTDFFGGGGRLGNENTELAERRRENTKNAISEVETALCLRVFAKRD